MRPEYRRTLDLNRRLRVSFYTSNMEKLAQAKFVFHRSGIDVGHYSHSREPYDENYSKGSANLLKSAANQISIKFGVRSLFFIEDTSLRIDALSDETDFPGLRVKEWFEETSFDELDSIIGARGGNRTATVKSDIALYHPRFLEPILFHGETRGQIAKTLPEFEPNPVYPWLTPRTFNGWFIPDGTSKRLGEMEVEESISYDFRAKALQQLIRRLTEYNFVANLPSSNFRASRPARASGAEPELPLGRSDRRILIFVGETCAGKTTAGDVLNMNLNAAVYEASGVLRDIAHDKGFPINDSDDAFKFLQENGFDLVARKLAIVIAKSDNDLHVVTGLRTISEISFLTDRFPEAEIICLEADPKTRFLRQVARARDGDPITFKEFQRKDEKQHGFGLLRVAKEIGDLIILNEGTSKESLRSYAETIIETAKKTENPKQKKDISVPSELIRCLLSLRRLGKLSTCDEIANETAKIGEPVKRYNTNRALKAVPELANRIEQKDELLSYELTNFGNDLLDLFQNRN